MSLTEAVMRELAEHATQDEGGCMSDSRNVATVKAEVVERAQKLTETLRELLSMQVSRRLQRHFADL